MKGIYYLAILIFLTACNQKSKVVERVSDSPVLAEVKGKKLYLDEVSGSGLLVGANSEKDSTLIINSYVQKWIRNQLMLLQAEKSLSDDIDIDLLVQDYRESLLLYNYEKNIIAQLLDTIITQDQIKDYYIKNGSQFKLSESILRCNFAKINANKPGIERFYANWKANKMVSAAEYLDRNAEISLLDNDKWYTSDEILSLLPDKITIKSLSTKKEVQTANEGSEYFVKILDYIDKSEDPPLSYVTSNIKKIILHDRKIELLAKLKEDLYQKDINGANVRIY